MAKKETRLVRLKPYDPKKGQNLKSLSRGGMSFKGGNGWTRMPLSLAKTLEDVTQDDREDGVKAFDICTDEEAKAIERRELREKFATVKQGVDKPIHVSGEMEDPDAMDDDDEDEDDEDEDEGEDEEEEEEETTDEAPSKPPARAAIPGAPKGAAAPKPAAKKTTAAKK